MSIVTKNYKSLKVTIPGDSISEIGNLEIEAVTAEEKLSIIVDGMTLNTIEKDSEEAKNIYASLRALTNEISHFAYPNRTVPFVLESER